jgi:hypothetical protein
MEASAVPAPQRLCPHCARLSRATGRRCPYCGRSFSRRVLPAVAAMLLVTAALVLGGLYVMLTAAADEVDSRIDREVDNVTRNVERDIRRELDRRLPRIATPAP